MWIAIALAAASCGRDPASTPVASNQVAPPGQPVLLAPAMDAVIPQNDPASGCPFNASRGSGSRLSFDWTDVTAEGGLAEYQIVVHGPRSPNLPIVDARVLPSEYVRLDCGGYVADPNLEGWVWKVRAFDRAGQAGEWTERRFHFGPCRVDGRFCGT